jgi:pimeloyl-ACP methyl ester carboxylesterase
MSLLPVTCESTTPGFDGAALERSLAALPPRAPVAVLIHGFRYAPGDAIHCPHGHILSLTPRRDMPRAISWPRHLRLAGPQDGLALAFGWQARGTIWQVQARTAGAAEALATLVATIRRLDPDRRVDLVAHSLGARVAMAALALTEACSVGRILLLAPADFRAHAETAMDSGAGRAAEVFSITSRANALFDLCMETLLSARLHASLAQGLSHPRQNWLDLRIDDSATETALARLGFPLRPASARICHWQPYLRPGVFALYRALLARRIGPAQIRAALRAGDPQLAAATLPDLTQAADAVLR